MSGFRNRQTAKVPSDYTMLFVVLQLVWTNSFVNTYKLTLIDNHDRFRFKGHEADSALCMMVVINSRVSSVSLPQRGNLRKEENIIGIIIALEQTIEELRYDAALNHIANWLTDVFSTGLQGEPALIFEEEN